MTKNATLRAAGLILFVLFLFFTSTDSYAQERSTLRVMALSGDDGSPITGANVLLFKGESSDYADLQNAGATDRDGLFEFERLSAGMYTVRVSFVGHSTYNETLTIEPGDRIVRRVTLDFDPAEFDEIVVEEQRRITTGEVGVRRITSADISRIPTPVAGGDLASYLQTLPGVVSVGDRGGELYVRGGNPMQNYILVDNLRIMKPFHISNLYSAFPGDMIQNVDMYAGGFGAEYSGATSAVVDISLRQGNMRRHQGSVSVSPYLTSMHYEGPLRVDQQSLILYGRFSTMDRTSPYLMREDVPLRFYDVTAKYSIQTDVVSCGITAIRTRDSGQINPLRELDLSWSNTVGGIRCLGFDGRFNYPIDLTIGFMDYRNSENLPDATESYSAIRDLYFRFDHKEEIFSYPIDYGFETRFRIFDTNLTERFADARSFNAARAIVSAYTTLEYDVTDRWTIQPGLTSQFTLQNAPTFEPRFRTAYSWGNRFSHELSAATGIYYQTMEGITDERDAGTVFTVLRPNEMDEPIPNSTHGILGYQIRSGSTLLNVEGFMKSHRNIPVSKWSPLARIEIETAMANGLSYGFDARLQLDRGRFFGFAGYGYTIVEYEAVSGDLGAWIEEPIFSYNPAHDQRHKMNVVGSYRAGGFTFNAGWEFTSGMPYTRVYGFDLALSVPNQNPLTEPGIARTLFSRPYGNRLPASHRLDVSVNRSFNVMKGVRIEAEAGAINLYDRDNIFYFDLNTLQRINQSPLMPYLSVQANFN